MIAPIAAPNRITAFCKDRDMRILSASATCSGRTPTPTTYPMIHFLPGNASTTFNCRGAWIGPSVLNTAFKALCAFTWRNCVTRVGDSRRCCTRFRIRSVTCPAQSGTDNIFAAATASWIARLIPTPPAGDIACAASPMHSKPGRCHRRSLGKRPKSDHAKPTIDADNGG